MKDDRELFERRTFWPRPGRPEAMGEIEFDRPCGNCGYNLRGLMPGAPCPECGSVEGLNLSDQPMPFEERHGLVAFVATVILAIFCPHETARQVWRPVRLDARAAQQFRRVCLMLAIPPLCAIAWTLTSAVIGPARAMWCLPFDAAAIIVWLNAVTLEPVAFFRDKVSSQLLRRVEVIALYASAPLALVPLHIGLLFVTYHTAQSTGEGWLIAAAIHLGVLLATMGLGVVCCAWLMYETVSVNAIGAFTFTFGRAISSIGTAAVMLIGLPAFTASVVARIFTS